MTERVERDAHRSEESMRGGRRPSAPGAPVPTWPARPRRCPRRTRCTCTRDDRASARWMACGRCGLPRRSRPHDANASTGEPASRSPRPMRHASGTAARPPAPRQRAGTRRRGRPPTRETTAFVACPMIMAPSQKTFQREILTRLSGEPDGRLGPLLPTSGPTVSSGPWAVVSVWNSPSPLIPHLAADQ